MNKKLYVILFAVFFCVFYILDVKACNDSDIYGLPNCFTGLCEWTCGNDRCNPGDNTLESILALDDNSKRTELLERIGRYCVSQTAVNEDLQIVKYSSIFPHWFDVCSNGFVNPEKRYKGDAFDTCMDDMPLHVYCCPPSRPVYTDINLYVFGGQRCYTMEEAQTQCDSGINVEGVLAQASSLVTYGKNGNEWNIGTEFSNNFYEPDISTFVCGGANCIKDTLRQKILNPGEYGYFGKELSYDEIYSNFLTCVPNGTPDGDVYGGCTLNPLDLDDRCVCFNGYSFSESFSKNVQGKAAAEIIISCNKMPEDQVNPCMQCIVKNWTSDQTDNAYRWSASLGCIDTRMNPFITRIIQIGLGLGSGIAVLRIIQGAFMRQTNDPAKIQEGNEIIIATVLGLAVLAGSVVLLQIIGVDILNLFSFQEYTSIVGG